MRSALEMGSVNYLYTIYNKDTERYYLTCSTSDPLIIGDPCAAIQLWKSSDTIIFLSCYGCLNRPLGDPAYVRVK